jgi:hypothetical protein
MQEYLPWAAPPSLETLFSSSSLIGAHALIAQNSIAQNSIYSEGLNPGRQRSVGDRQAIGPPAVARSERPDASNPSQRVLGHPKIDE